MIRNLLSPLAVSLLLASCATAPHDPGRVTLPAAVPKALAVQPIAAKARDQSETLRGQVSTLASSAREAHNEATAAREEAEKLKTAGTATAAQLQELWESSKSVEARNLFLESQSADLTASEATLRGTLADLQTAASAKDAEADSLRVTEAALRGDVEQAAAARDVAYLARDASEKRALASDAAAAKYRLIRNIALGAGGLFLALFVFKLFRP